MTKAKSAPSSKTNKKKKNGDLGDETSSMATINPPPIDGGGSRPPVSYEDRPKRPRA